MRSPHHLLHALNHLAPPSRDRGFFLLRGRRLQPTAVSCSCSSISVGALEGHVFFFGLRVLFITRWVPSKKSLRRPNVNGSVIFSCFQAVLDRVLTRFGAYCQVFSPRNTLKPWNSGKPRLVRLAIPDIMHRVHILGIPEPRLDPSVFLVFCVPLPLLGHFL